MILLLLFILLAICEIYFLHKFKKITSPTVLLTALFIVGTIFAAIGNIEWKITVNPWLIFVMLFGIIAMAMGEGLAYRVKSRSNYSSGVISPVRRIVLFRWVHCLNILLLSICLFMFIREQVDLAYQVGYDGHNLFRWIRYGHHFAYVDNSTIIKICKAYMTASAYVYLFILLYNCFYLGAGFRLSDSVYLFPVAFYAVFQIFTGARSGFITLAVFVLICTFLLLDKRKGVNILKAIKWSVLAVVSFLLVFSLLGILTDKTTDSNFFENIKIYTGSSIVALSMYLDNFQFSGGVESFVGIVNIFIELFGDHTNSFSLEYVYFANGSSTNIYTAFRSYLNDYSYIGLFLIQFIIGFVFGYWHKCIFSNRKVVPLQILLYGYYMHFVVLSLFTPSLTSSFLTVGRIIDLCAIFIMYKATMILGSKIIRMPRANLLLQNT